MTISGDREFHISSDDDYNTIIAVLSEGSMMLKIFLIALHSARGLALFIFLAKISVVLRNYSYPGPSSMDVLTISLLHF